MDTKFLLSKVVLPSIAFIVIIVVLFFLPSDKVKFVVPVIIDGVIKRALSIHNGSHSGH